jgi:pimeloyl-ACP methyl ester carboxylesterase
LPGIDGLPKWTPFLNRLASTRRVIAPSLPGFPGAAGHDELDTIFDWLLATRDVLLAAGLEGADLMAVLVSGALAADVAGVWPGLVRKLVLLAPFGLFTPADPPVDIWAQRPGQLSGLMCARRETSKAFIEQPDDADPLEWKVEQMRALEASARYLFPTGNTGLAQRLHRIQCPVLLLRGADDRVMTASYLDRFAAGIAGHTVVKEIRGAGHLAELDRPEEVARTVLDFLDS